MQRGNRESTIQRKLRYFNTLHGTPDEMVTQILSNSWVDKSKKNALDMVYQYAEFLGVEIRKPDSESTITKKCSARANST